MSAIGHAHKPRIKGFVLLNSHRGNLWLAVKTQTCGHCDSAVSYHQSRNQKGKRHDTKKISLEVRCKECSGLIVDMACDLQVPANLFLESHIQKITGPSFGLLSRKNEDKNL